MSETWGAFAHFDHSFRTHATAKPDENAAPSSGFSHNSGITSFIPGGLTPMLPFELQVPVVHPLQKLAVQAKVLRK